MRALICWSAIGFIAVAISLATDEKAKDNLSSPDAKAAGSATNKPDAPGESAGASSRDKSAPQQEASDKPARKSGEKYVAVQTEPGDQQPSKYAAEEQAILDAGLSFVKAYADHDARRVAAHFAPDAEFIDEEGQEFRGRDQIEACVAKVFQEQQQVSLSIDVESLRVLSPVLAIETGTTICTQDDKMTPHVTHYTAVHTKSDGQWLVASVREEKLRGPRVHAARVQELDWLVGNWIDEDETSLVQFDCRMIESGNYLIRDFQVVVAGQSVLSGSQRTGWDPVSGKLRAWTFDSDGGYFEGTWHRDGEKWVLTSLGVTADGQEAAGTAIFTLVDANTITWQAVDRKIDGERLEDSDQFTLVRKGPQPDRSDETAAN